MGSQRQAFRPTVASSVPGAIGGRAGSDGGRAGGTWRLLGAGNSRARRTTWANLSLGGPSRVGSCDTFDGPADAKVREKATSCPSAERGAGVSGLPARAHFSQADMQAERSLRALPAVGAMARSHRLRD